MTITDVIEMARKAGMRWEGGFTRVVECVTEEELNRFASLVRAAALEEAAEEADRWQTALHDPRYECDCATAIRALKGTNMNKMINDGWELNGHVQPEMTGFMTLRDYFAGKTLQGFITSLDTGEKRLIDVPQLAKSAYSIADAMLKAREASND